MLGVLGGAGGGVGEIVGGSCSLQGAESSELPSAQCSGLV